MIPNAISDTFQPRIDFSYGLDVEIRPKLTPGMPARVHRYSIVPDCHSHSHSHSRRRWLWLWQGGIWPPWD